MLQKSTFRTLYTIIFPFRSTHFWGCHYCSNLPWIITLKQKLNINHHFNWKIWMIHDMYCRFHNRFWMEMTSVYNSYTFRQYITSARKNLTKEFELCIENLLKLSFTTNTPFMLNKIMKYKENTNISPILRLMYHTGRTYTLIEIQKNNSKFSSTSF